jgi:hypothetical protein
MITEEHITRAAANKLEQDGWEIIAVHPPDGQGPFTIPKPPRSRAIERASYHPDIVAIKKENEQVKVLLVECKIRKPDLVSDVQKFQDLANNPDSLYFVCFRCQRFKGGPEISVDYEVLSAKDSSDLPIEFAFAYQKNTGNLNLPSKINNFKCFELSFTEEELL